MRGFDEIVGDYTDHLNDVAAAALKLCHAAQMDVSRGCAASLVRSRDAMQALIDQLDRSKWVEKDTGFEHEVSGLKALADLRAEVARTDEFIARVRKWDSPPEPTEWEDEPEPRTEEGEDAEVVR